MKHNDLIKKIQDIWANASPNWQAPEASKFHSNTIFSLEQLISANELETLRMKEQSDDIVKIARSLYNDM